MMLVVEGLVLGLVRLEACFFIINFIFIFLLGVLLCSTGVLFKCEQSREQAKHNTEKYETAQNGEHLVGDTVSVTVHDDSGEDFLVPEGDCYDVLLNVVLFTDEEG